MTDDAILSGTTGSISKTRGTAAQWGLASLLLGGILALMAMLMLQINLHMFLTARGWSPGDVRPIRYAAAVGAVFVAAITGASIAFAVRGLSLSRKHDEPGALSWAGLMISTLALLMWIATFVDLFAILEMLLRGSMAFR